ncbi:MAG: HD domain-containing phosphohydrolase [bacterium]
MVKRIVNLQEIIRRQKVLLNLGRQLAHIEDIVQLLREIANRTSEIMNAERSSVFLYDEVKDELWSIVAEGEDEIRFSASLGIGGYVFRTGEIVVEDDVYNNPLFNREIDKKTGYRTKSMLCVPIYNQKGKIMGVYQVINRHNGAFQKDDVEFLLAIAGQVSVVLQNALLLENMKRMFESLIDTLAESIDMRDTLTAGHSKRVMEWTMKITDKLGISNEDKRKIKYAAYLHDYGKIILKDAILLKTGPLVEEELREIKKHVEYTQHILDRIEFEDDLKDVPRIACLHHERLDGSGYPFGLKGDEIPIGSRIIAVCDVFDALTSKRHYRNPLPIKKAFELLENESGIKFDKRVVNALKEILIEEGSL